ncbi:MAG: hypothetical protein HY217_05170, partial [Candidatus Rokubacteria bacterium]|nr:hypothetical protein [Candidatus Rokubacteria bacterium]
MTRGPRVHRFFVEMATELARDHRVTVLATPPELGAFAGILGVEVHGYETLDLLSEHGVRPPRLPDPEPGEVAAIERELGLPVYRAAGNYLLFGRIIREAGGRWNYLTTDSEIVATYAGAYHQLVRIFDRVRPDVVFFEAMDLISSFVAFALARRRGVFSFEPRFSPLGGGRISLGFGVYRRNVVMEHLYRHRH